jgi:hypothetical protein
MKHYAGIDVSLEASRTGRKTREIVDLGLEDSLRIGVRHGRERTRGHGHLIDHRGLDGRIEPLDLGTAGKFNVLSDELRVWPPQFLALREEGAVGLSLKHAVLRRVAGFLERRVREEREEPYQPYQRNRSNR